VPSEFDVAIPAGEATEIAAPPDMPEPTSR
jgi:hypothetical protein